MKKKTADLSTILNLLSKNREEEKLASEIAAKSKKELDSELAVLLTKVASELKQYTTFDKNDELSYSDIHTFIETKGLNGK